MIVHTKKVHNVIDKNYAKFQGISKSKSVRVGGIPYSNIGNSPIDKLMTFLYHQNELIERR
jgi:hypothetical protein